MPPDRDARLARRETLGGSRRRNGNGANGGQLAASDATLQPALAEWVQERPAWDLYEPDVVDSTGQSGPG